MKKLLILFLVLPFLSKAITPVFLCGFECGVSSSHGISVPAFNTTTVRSGSRSMEVNVSGSNSASSVSISSSTSRVVRFYIRFATLPNVDAVIYGTNSGSVPTIGVMFKQSDGKLYAGSETTGPTYSFGSTGVTVSTGTWYRVDCYVNSSANPWTCDVQVDAASCGQYTLATASANVIGNQLGITGGTFTAQAFFDDYIISNTSGDYPIGAGHINHFIPTADGTHNVAGASDFERTLTGTDILNATTDAFQLVDDVPLETGTSVDWINMIAPPNAGDYVQLKFGPASGISTPTTGPKAVVVIAAIHQAGTGLGNMSLNLHGSDNATATIYSATGVAGVTSIAYKTSFHLNAPNGTPWGVSGGENFNNLFVDFGSPATVDANPDQYFDCIMIEAEFSDVTLTVPGTPSDKRHTTLGVGYPQPLKK